MRTLIWLLAVGTLAALTAPAAAGVALVPVATGLTQPTFVTHAGDGSGRLFIVEQPGTIRVVPSGGGTPTLFLDITGLVQDTGNEEGLLSVAFHPSYPSPGDFYVYYTANGGDNRLARYSVSGNPDLADPTETSVLDLPHPGASNHNGGQLQFGSDGFLYVSVGDGANAGNSQDLTSLLGKILRIDVDPLPYTIPPGNPFTGGGVREEIWALGLRNPWRFSFDRANGNLIVADVGQNAREELDGQPADTGGLNYCWGVKEGTLPGPSGGSCTGGTPTEPILEYGTHDANRCAITGGYVYRGSAGTFPAGTYVFGDFCSGEIWTFANGFVSLLFDTDLLITSFGEDEAGELYLAHQGGSVHRFAGSPAPELAVGLNRLLAYRPGDTLRVGLSARIQGPAATGDFYLVIATPDGQLVFITGLAPLAAVGVTPSASPATFPALATGITLGSGFELAMTEVLAYGFTGVESAGTYQVIAVLAAPGAFADGTIDAGDILMASVQSLTFSP